MKLSLAGRIEFVTKFYYLLCGSSLRYGLDLTKS